MYEEERKSSGTFIKDLIIKLLYMLLFLFLFMWLYPAPKVDLKDVKVKVDKTELEPLFAGVFNDNITAMKDAARAYFTTDRLPSANGGTAKLTLQEMLSKKMLTPFVDANGKSCDTNASYVEVTRNSAYNYNMKVYLSCSDKKDYINETIGCTSICPGCVNAPTTVATNTTKTTTTNRTTGGYGSPSTTVVRPSTTQTVVKPNENNNTNTNPTPQRTYEYVKEVEQWNTDNTWTTTRKNTSDTVKLVDTRTTRENDRVRRTYTYRTVSWVFGQDSGENYTLYLNNIPYDAEDVRIVSQSKFSSNSELRNYANNRYSCVIEMAGYGCPRRGDSDDIQNEALYYTEVANFSYNTLRVRRQGNKWTVPVSYRNNRVVSGDWSQYIAPIKFTVEWYENDYETVKQYKYSYKTTTKDYKYSNTNNDTSLLNNGYRLTGNVK